MIRNQVIEQRISKQKKIGEHGTAREMSQKRYQAMNKIQRSEEEDLRLRNHEQQIRRADEK